MKQKSEVGSEKIEAGGQKSEGERQSPVVGGSKSYTVVAERRHAVNATTLRTVLVEAQNPEDAERRARETIAAERTADDQFEIRIVSITEVVHGG